MPLRRRSGVEDTSSAADASDWTPAPSGGVTIVSFVASRSECPFCDDELSVDPAGARSTRVGWTAARLAATT
eukprot:7386482-Prymnesium_polylepis.1